MSPLFSFELQNPYESYAMEDLYFFVAVPIAFLLCVAASGRIRWKSALTENSVTLTLSEGNAHLVIQIDVGDVIMNWDCGGLLDTIKGRETLIAAFNKLRDDILAENFMVSSVATTYLCKDRLSVRFSDKWELTYTPHGKGNCTTLFLDTQDLTMVLTRCTEVAALPLATPAKSKIGHKKPWPYK